MRNVRATDGSGSIGAGFKGPHRIPTGSPSGKRMPGDMCECGHPRVEHKRGSKACRRIYVQSGRACGCEEFTKGRHGH